METVQCIVQFLPRCMECRRRLTMRILSVRPSTCLSFKRVHCDTRNSSEDEIANVNFLYDDMVRALYEIQIPPEIDGVMYVFERRFTKVIEITQCNEHYAIQGHSRSPSDFGTNRKLIYDFLLVINTNLPPILHRFQVMAHYWSHFR